MTVITKRSHGAVDVMAVKQNRTTTGDEAKTNENERNRNRTRGERRRSHAPTSVACDTA